MATRTDPVQRAAVQNYRRMWRALQDLARECEESKRPLLARKRRHQASIAHRAAFAELYDPEPQ